MQFRCLLKGAFAVCVCLQVALAGGAPEKVQRPPGRAGHMAAVVGGKLFVAGGDTSGVGEQKRLDSWNPADGTWTALAPMPRGRSLGAIVSLGDRLYILGGIGGDNGPMADVEVFSMKSQTWEQPVVHDPLPSRVAAAALGDEIFVIGGIDLDQHLPDPVHSRRVVSFNPRSGAWTPRANLRIGRHGHAAAVFDHHIYVSGGDGSPELTHSVEVYDPSRNEWHDGPALQRPHEFHGMAVVDGKLIVFGTRGRDRVIEILDPIANKWTDGPPMPLERNRFAWGVIGDRLYVIDGEDEHGATPPTIQMFDGRRREWSGLKMGAENAVPATAPTTRPSADRP